MTAKITQWLANWQAIILVWETWWKHHTWSLWFPVMQVLLHSISNEKRIRYIITLSTKAEHTHNLQSFSLQSLKKNHNHINCYLRRHICYDSQTILLKTIYGKYGQSWKGPAKWARKWVSKPYLARRENRSKWKPWEVCIICRVYFWICNWISVQKLPCLTQWQVLLQAFPS